MIVWIAFAACQRAAVIRREHAADEGDDGQAIVAAIAQRIDIPPEICTRFDRLVEPRCAISVAAASCPDIAAIGTPGPGCTLPPAAYKPGIRVRAPFLENADIQP